jgi:hypothetical protein
MDMVVKAKRVYRNPYILHWAGTKPWRFWEGEYSIQPLSLL